MIGISICLFVILLLWRSKYCFGCESSEGRFTLFHITHFYTSARTIMETRQALHGNLQDTHGGNIILPVCDGGGRGSTLFVQLCRCLAGFPHTVAVGFSRSGVRAQSQIWVNHSPLQKVFASEHEHIVWNIYIWIITISLCISVMLYTVDMINLLVITNNVANI